VFALAGEENDRRFAAFFLGGAKQFDSVLRAEPVIDQAYLVLVVDHGLQASGEILHPLDLNPLSAEVGEQFAGKDIIVLVVFDEQHPKDLS